MTRDQNYEFNHKKGQDSFEIIKKKLQRQETRPATTANHT